MRASILIILSLLFVLACSNPPDTVEPPVDAGTPVVDGGTLDDDGGSTESDAGTNQDAGTMRDAGAPTAELGGVLFIGNSYTSVNDIPGRYRRIAEVIENGPVRVESVSPGGYRLAQHAMDANTTGTALYRWLREERSFDAVVLQEQSQLGGFVEGSPDRLASVEGASELASLLRVRNSRAVLYLTWGREHGDENNPQLFGTFEAMQARLDKGYLALAEYLRAQGTDVQVAPVGGGFRIVYEDVTNSGSDPLAPGSDFDALYNEDGSHPSEQGAFLAACILAGRITGADVASFADDPVLGAEVSARLRDVCARALVDPRWSFSEPLLADRTITFPDAQIGSEIGAAVAINEDGSSVLVGFPGGIVTRSFGGARNFIANGIGWMPAWVFVAPQGASNFGAAIAMSDDGQRALFGASDTFSTGGLAGVGRAHVFRRSTGPWIEAANFEPAAPQSWQRFGQTVAMSGDGQRVVVSAPGEDEGAGSARVFVRTDLDEWIEESRLLPKAAVAPGDAFGFSLALDEQGTRALVTAPRFNQAEPGYAVVFTWTSTDGWTEEERIESPVAEADTRFGSAAALTADGSRAIIGASLLDAATVFIRTDTTWSIETTLRPPRELDGSFTLSVARPAFGHAVAISRDGLRVLVGAPGTHRADGAGAGSAFSFVRVGDVFRFEQLLVPTRSGYTHHFGQSVAISADGTAAIVGAPGERFVGTNGFPVGQGAAHTFRFP